METAGKQVDDDEMRELMKENGIGRPSTRASIIETLFRRKYIERKKKLVIATQTGIQLIDLIDNELLKSAELTGRWEKRLKEIERGEFNAGTFIKNMKKMVDELVYEVRSHKSTTRISSATVISNVSEKSQTSPQKTKTKKQVAGKSCPKCSKGSLLKGTTAFGCSAYASGCTFKIPFEFLEKKISENQLIRLLDKGCTTNLKGFKTVQGKVEGLVRFDENFELIFEVKKKKSKESIHCPKCKKGTILKGNTAYGCSDYKLGCSFIYTFEDLKTAAKGKPLTKELVLQLLNG